MHNQLSSLTLSCFQGIAIDLQFLLNNDLALEKSFLLNTSPEFEFAAYTVVALAGGEGTYIYNGDEIVINAPTVTQSGKQSIDTVTISFAGTHKGTTKHSGSATTRKPIASDADLQKLVDTMWNEDKDKPTAAEVQMDWGTHISGKTGTKNKPLFSKVDETLFKKKQYADLITTYDKNLLTPDVCKAEPAMSGFRKQYFQTVFNTFTATPMFASAFNYLKEKNIHGTNTLDNFKSSVLWPLWFGVYTRCKGPLGSSGWEHVFSGEIKGNGVDGQHDWVRYYLQQKADKIVYDGYYEHADNLIGTFQYTWLGATKPKGGFITGTSPAFDFSILTVCALAHGNGAHCQFNLNGHRITVTSYTQACGDQSGTCLATAYPSL
ncbi:unnamed protein product [Caenorhabditis bovis]|uniref:EndoU domain-containing protein n=1 Tax=Caenorhabditis bovis TaxID=2654633 RepID=A0A8S1EFW7_9PELO|nr:unnamed protein product [Caenorhabditis bovis]